MFYITRSTFPSDVVTVTVDELRSKDTRTLRLEWFPEVVCQVVILLVNYTCFHEKVQYLGFVWCAVKTRIMETHLS